ncbi:NAD(P)H-binding protein [Streptomyces sp. NBC_01476]|uniref:SDR family oxidoreductase n=1 Tax=Streptomyces sp. NBC_01476 TaxID=2903881 RepID=UPI002E3296BA|nr:NAD(P)H-binding protein [Streptomyces sp. NBC_01476]
MIIVTGATGNVGRPLVAALAEAGEEVRAVSRRPSVADSPSGVQYVVADLADPPSLGAAFDGGDALFLLLAGELLGGAGDPAQILEAARAGGVRRVVLLSSQITGTRPDSGSHEALQVFERAVRESGLDWTILRAGGFASNAYAWADSVRKDRVVAWPFADVALPVLHPADIADVAAVVLREPGHAGQVYDLTGPEAITPREQAAALGTALDAEVRFVELTREQAAEHMARFMPPSVVEGTLDILGTPLPVEQQVSPDVEKILGRRGRTFADWARQNAAAFA